MSDRCSQTCEDCILDKSLFLFQLLKCFDIGYPFLLDSVREDFARRMIEHIADRGEFTAQLELKLEYT